MQAGLYLGLTLRAIGILAVLLQNGHRRFHTTHLASHKSNKNMHSTYPHTKTRLKQKRKTCSIANDLQTPGY